MASSDEVDLPPVKDMDEAAAQLRSSRSGKASHLTRRMNIVNNLMTDKEYLDEVKGNMLKFSELSVDFKALHVSYAQMLDDSAREEDDEKWYQPRSTHINSFLAKVTKWITDIENADSLDVTQVEGLPAEEGAYANEGGGLSEVDTHSVRSITSSHSSSSSLRINAEAERAALLAKASMLELKHAIEKQEQILQKKRETIELQTEIAANAAKINYLKDNELARLGPVQAEAAAATLMDAKPEMSAQPWDRGAPVVRSKTGAPLHFPFLNVREDSAHSVPDVHHEDSINDQHQPQPALVHNIPPVIPQSTQPTLPQGQSPPMPSTAKDDHMFQILENQSSLTRILVKQQLLSTLPQGNIPPFDGHIMEYKSFLHSFEHCIENKTDNNRDRLQFLIQFTRGQAQRLVKSCEYTKR